MNDVLVCRNKIKRKKFEFDKPIRMNNRFNDSINNELDLYMLPELKDNNKITNTIKDNKITDKIEEIGVKKSIGKRYIPLNFLNNKDINYCLYCALQLYSERNINEVERYLYKRKINNTQLARELNMCRATVIKKTKALIDVGLIRHVKLDNGEEVYYFPILDGKKYLLLNLMDNSIKDLINSNNPCALKIYLYLKARTQMFKAQGKKIKDMEVEQGFLCKQIGLSHNSRNLIPSYLELLKNLKLIEYRIAKSEKKVIRDITKYKYVYTVLK